MSFRWSADPDGVSIPELDQTWTDQAQAEAWLAEFWADLAESGASAVSLWEADRLVYGPMSLDEA